MNEILSNEEIDTLLEVFRAEGTAPDDEPAVEQLSQRVADGTEPLVAQLDLLKPNRLTTAQLRALTRLFENSSKALSATASDRLRLDIACDCVAVEQVRFSTWLPQVGNATAIYVLNMPPLEQPVLFTVTSELLYGAVDRVLGGSGRVETLRDDFTQAEFTVADAFVGPCLDRICDALRDVVDLEWSVEQRTCNPGVVNVLPDHEVVVSVYYQASSEFLFGDLRLMLPFSSLESRLGGLVTEQGQLAGIVPGANREELSRGLRDVAVELAVDLGGAELALRDLLQLDRGDVVPLNTRVGQNLVATVQDVPKFTGQVGRRGRRLAYQVVDVKD